MIDKSACKKVVSLLSLYIENKLEKESRRIREKKRKRDGGRMREE